MHLFKIALFVAQFAAVHAAIRARQCYPGTVYVTVSADPPASRENRPTRTVTTTETLISLSTVTSTRTVAPIMQTTVVNSPITIKGPPVIVTHTVQVGNLSSTSDLGATPATTPLAVSTQFITVTQTVMQTEDGSGARTAPFPTLNVTGTMGINPSGVTAVSGAVESTGVLTDFSSNSTSITATDAAASPPLSTQVSPELSNATDTLLQSTSLIPTEAGTISTATSSTSASVTDLQPSSSMSSSEPVFHGPIMTEPFPQSAPSSSSAGIDSFQLSTTEALPSQMSTPTPQLNSSVTAVQNSSSSLVDSAAVTVSSTSIISSVSITEGPNMTVVTSTVIPVPLLSESGSSSPFFPNSTTALASEATAANATSSVASTTENASSTGGLQRRCVGDTHDLLRREIGPIDYTILDDGSVVTFPIDVAVNKRQVGSVVTATINGQVVTWLNSWDGASSVDLATFGTQKTSVVSLTTQSSQSTSEAVQMTMPSTAPLPRISEIKSLTTMSVASPLSTTTKPTDQIPTFVPPAWLTSLVPIAPTGPHPTTTDFSTSVTDLPSSSSSASPTVGLPETTASASCGEVGSGKFTINFDELTRSAQQSSTPEQFPTLPNPYHHLYWAQGYSYVPPPNDPFLPHSGSQLGIFSVDPSANVHSQNWTAPVPQGAVVNGMLGAGTHYADPQFYIDAYGVWIGCQNTGKDECDIQVNGYGYDDMSGKTYLMVEQHFYQAPCETTGSCALEHFEFSAAFHNLTALQIQASPQGSQGQTGLTFYLDDLDLGWTDNSCGAVMARAESQ